MTKKVYIYLHVYDTPICAEIEFRTFLYVNMLRAFDA